MKKIIMLTIIGICGILLFVGCKNGKKLEPITEEDLAKNEKQEVAIQQEEAEKSIPEVYNYNESGKIIIAMYHKFTSRNRERRVD